MPLNDVDYYAETLIAQRIARVTGVAQVQVNGSQTYAVRVQVDPQRLAAYGLGIDDIQTAVANANQNQPTGTLWGAQQAFTIQSNGQLLDAAAYRPIIVAYHANNPVRLQDVANVIDSVQNDKEAAWYNHKPAVVLAVLKQPGSNTIQTVDSIKKLLPHVQRFGSEEPQSGRVVRPISVNQKFSRRRAIHAIAHRGPGYFRHLYISGQSFCHFHSQPGTANLHRGHVRCDETSWIQLEQPIVDGPFTIGRICCRRRHCHAGELSFATWKWANLPCKRHTTDRQKSDSRF